MTTAFVLFAVLSAARAAETFNGQTYFFGDLHAHTGVSKDGYASDGGDGDWRVHKHWESVSVDCNEANPDCGAMADVYDIAIANGLDFMALTDHDDSDEADFDWLLSLSLARTDILVIPAVELKYSTPGVAKYGHKNMYVFQDDMTKLAGLDLATFAVPHSVTGDCDVDIWENVADVNETYGNALLWAHSPSAMAVQTTDWDCHDEQWEPVVEIYSTWGNALTSGASYDPIDDGIDKAPDDVDTEAGTVHEALARGYKLGFVGGTDEHETRPGGVCHVAGGSAITGHDYAGGLTIVVLDGDDETVELTRKGIYDQIMARQTLVTSGPPIPLQVEWTLASGEPRRIGKTIRVGTTGSTTLTVRVPGEYEDLVGSVRAVYDDTTAYSLRKSGTEVGTWSRAIANATIPDWLYVEVEIDGAMYYAEHPRTDTPDGDCPDGGTNADEYLWSSPTWFTH